jgi:hypothetical protein
MDEPHHGRWWTIGTYLGLVSDQPRPVRYSRTWWLSIVISVACGLLGVALLDRFT